jgi:hypothetical protein
MELEHGATQRALGVERTAVESVAVLIPWQPLRSLHPLEIRLRATQSRPGAVSGYCWR